MIVLVRWLVPAALLAGALPIAPSAVHAQPADGIARVLLVPLDFGQGAMIDAEDGTPYTASVRLQAAIGLWGGAPVRIGPVAAVRFANPDWTSAAGIRGQWLPLRFGLGGRRWGLGLSAEQLWGTGAHRPAYFGVVGDLELVRLGGWLVRDWNQDRRGFEFSLGTDLRSLWAVFVPPEDRDPFPDVP